MYIKLFENFEVVEPIKYGDPLNNKEINFLKGYNIMCPEFIQKDDNYYYIFDHRCENIKDLPLTYINAVCKRLNIFSYNINDDHTIDVDDNIDISFESLSKIPLKFNNVSGDFLSYNNMLSTLEGSPKSVGGDFCCPYNRLVTLKGGPEYVGKYFDCSKNKLTNLEGSPKYIGRDFDCRFNPLTSRKYKGFIKGRLLTHKTI